MNVDTPHTSPTSQGFAAQEREKQQLRRIISALQGTWRIPLIASIIFLVLAIGVLVSVRANFPPTKVFISQFHFTFPTSESGRYPNNTPFSINEILDPPILDVVYDQLDLSKYEVDRNQFYGSFSIRPFALVGSEISDRFHQKMTDRRLSFVERERLELQLKAELSLASRSAAELSFFPQRTPMIPIPVGRAIVHKVPLVWSQLAIENKGVLRIPGFSSTATVIDPETVNRQSLHLGIVSIIEASERLDERLTELLKTAGVLTLRDSISGKSIRDLERDLRDLQLFYVNPLRSRLVQYRFDDGGAVQQIAERRISDLEVRVVGLAKQADAVGGSVESFVQATAGLRGRLERKPSEGGGAVSGGSTIPQVGETFIDRIIELTRRDRETEQDRNFITERTQKQFDLSLAALALRSEQTRWKNLLADLQSDAVTRKELDDATRGETIRQIRHAIDEANAEWATLSRLETQFAASRTGRTGEIYAPYVTERDVITNDRILSTPVIGSLLSAILIFFLGLWVIRAILVLVRS